MGYDFKIWLRADAPSILAASELSLVLAIYGRFCIRREVLTRTGKAVEKNKAKVAGWNPSRAQYAEEPMDRGTAIKGKRKQERNTATRLSLVIGAS